MHLIGPHTFVWENVENFKRPPMKPRAKIAEILSGTSLGKGNENGRGRLTKVVAMFIYGKAFLKCFSPEPNKLWGLIFAQIIGEGKSTKIAKMMVLR